MVPVTGLKVPLSTTALYNPARISAGQDATENVVSAPRAIPARSIVMLELEQTVVPAAIALEDAIKAANRVPQTKTLARKMDETVARRADPAGMKDGIGNSLRCAHGRNCCRRTGRQSDRMLRHKVPSAEFRQMCRELDK